MKGFILACGHSGTTWSARALRAATDLEARHESWRRSIGRDFDGVESNGNLWKKTAELVHLFPEAAVVHQVRDGRLVVRTIMMSKPGDFFESACRRWTARNERLLVEICNSDRFRLEDLTTSFRVFSAFSRRLGAGRIDRSAWERIRVKRINESPPQKRRRFPPADEWTAEQREIFRQTCGQLMTELRYR